MRSVVYKSLRKADTYIFLRGDEAFDSIPDELRATLGQLVKVMALELGSDRKLARAEAVVVMAALEERGYYLQLPPLPEA